MKMQTLLTLHQNLMNSLQVLVAKLFEDLWSTLTQYQVQVQKKKYILSMIKLWFLVWEVFGFGGFFLFWWRFFGFVFWGFFGVVFWFFFVWFVVVLFDLFAGWLVGLFLEVFLVGWRFYTLSIMKIQALKRIRIVSKMPKISKK